MVDAACLQRLLTEQHLPGSENSYEPGRLVVPALRETGRPRIDDAVRAPGWSTASSHTSQRDVCHLAEGIEIADLKERCRWRGAVALVRHPGWPNRCHRPVGATRHRLSRRSPSRGPSCGRGDHRSPSAKNPHRVGTSRWRDAVHVGRIARVSGRGAAGRRAPASKDRRLTRVYRAAAT
jgi:hypothetical protein